MSVPLFVSKGFRQQTNNRSTKPVTMVPRPQRFWIPASAWRPAPVYLTAEPLLVRMDHDTDEHAVSSNADTESLPDAFASQQGNAGPDDPGFDYVIHDEPPIGRDEYGEALTKSCACFVDAINGCELHLATDRGRQYLTLLQFSKPS